MNQNPNIASKKNNLSSSKVKNKKTIIHIKDEIEQMSEPRLTLDTQNKQNNNSLDKIDNNISPLNS